jgi:Domain of unknown function (DUF4190)
MTDPLGPVNQNDPPHSPATGVPLVQRTSGMAITGLVLGILGLCFIPFGITALILGIIALTQIADPARALTGRGLAITATVLGGLSLTLAPIALLIGIMLPALGAARRAARQMQNTTQVRGITQGMVTYAGSNKGNFPGINAYGDPVDLTVEGRFAEMLDQNLFSGEYLISPSETKIVWTAGPVTMDNYSYALLDISDPGLRRSAWRRAIGYIVPVISDRNTGTSGASTDVMSIHTNFPGDWAGSVGFNDGSATFENYHEIQTRYGSGPVNPNDNLFEMAGNDDAMMIYTGD